MPPVSLSDDQLAIVMACAQPIPASDRAQFLEDVAAQLAQYRELGPGWVSRIATAEQRKVFRPPDLRDSDREGKYSR